MDKRTPFKEIPITTKPLDTKAHAALKHFNKTFSTNQVQLSYIKNKVTIHLHEVDLDKMKVEIDRIIKICELPPRKNILHAVQEKISTLGGFSRRGGTSNFTDYNKEVKVKNRVGKEQQRNKLGYARDDFSREVNAVPAKFDNQIICGDSAKILKKLPDNSIDLIFTSPPYNFGLEYAQGGDEQKWDKYFDELFLIFSECIRVVKYGGRIIVNVQPLYSDYVPTHHVIGEYFRKQGLIWRGEIMWEKNNYNCKYTAWGSWKSPSNPYLKYSWEFLEVFCKGSLKKDGARENADIEADEFKKWVYGKWSIAPSREMKKYDHPAMFPEELARRALRLFSFQGDIVLDPFCGVGTAAVVAKKTGRRYLGVDISKKYCAVARYRLAEILL